MASGDYFHQALEADSVLELLEVYTHSERDSARRLWPSLPHCALPSAQKWEGGDGG